MVRDAGRRDLLIVKCDPGPPHSPRRLHQADPPCAAHHCKRPTFARAVAKLADAGDLRSLPRKRRPGSTPGGTNKHCVS